MKSDVNVKSLKLDSWTYKTKLIESIDMFAQEHFPDIKRRKEITLAMNICKEMSNEQKIGARIVRRSLENNINTNFLKFENQVLKGFAITWYKQPVIHYVDFNKIGKFFHKSLFLKMITIIFCIGVSAVSLLKRLLCNKNLIVNIIDAKLCYKIIFQCCNIVPLCKFRDPFVADWLINGQQKNTLENLVIFKNDSSSFAF